MTVGLYARVSTHDQQTLPMQLRTMRAYAKQRGWIVGMEVRDIGSGANLRPKREEMLKAARRRKLDVILVWRLDRWGRSLLDLIGTLQELNELGVSFVSLSEALDLTTASGRALAGMLSVFAEFERDILRDRVKAGIAQARREGRPHGRPSTVQGYADEVQALHGAGVSKSEIARRLSISRTSVRRFLEP
jgi:putative DNA-invertase from lambdoid prophage Rac